MNLRPGDLLFYPVSPKSRLWSKIIAAAQLFRREGTGTVQYSHVSVVSVDTEFELEAYIPFARRHRIDWSRGQVVMRVRGATEQQRNLAAMCAASMVGQVYDIGRMLFGMFKMSRANICTTFAARAWDEAGVHLADKAGRFVAPNELAESPLLEVVS